MPREEGATNAHPAEDIYKRGQTTTPQTTPTLTRALAA